MLFETLASLSNRLLGASQPEGQVHFKKKLGWTLGILIIYFALANIPLFGLDKSSTDLFELYHVFFAGVSGSLMVLGILPGLTASIILIFLARAKIAKMDFSDPHQLDIFFRLKKLLIFVVVAMDALVQILGDYMRPDAGLAVQLGVSVSVIKLFLFMQICIGGILILYMSEIVSKKGICSGWHLFVAATISQRLVNGMINWKIDHGLPIGLIPRWIYLAKTGLPDGIVNFFINTEILSLISTIAIFLISVYVLSTRLEIPLAHADVRGARGRFPINLMYIDHVPLALTFALLANIHMIGRLLYSRGVMIFGEFRESIPINGLIYYLTPPSGPRDWIPSLVMEHYTYLGVSPPEIWQIGLRLLISSFILISSCIIFALFWNEKTGMGGKSVAERIQKARLRIPGYKGSNALERVMQHYIPRVTVMAGAITGAIAMISNLTEIIGGLEGTYLLFVVSIMYEIYEDLASEWMIEMHPMFV